MFQIMAFHILAFEVSSEGSCGHERRLGSDDRKIAVLDPGQRK
jgi:hypothetical protein